MRIGNYEYKIDSHGVLSQVEPQPITYDPEYALAQKTTREMAMLRLGYIKCLCSNFGIDKGAKVLELGPGNGIQMEVMKEAGFDVYGYDLANTEHSTVSAREVRLYDWDVVLAFDVVEHMPDYHDFWRIRSLLSVISVPWTPSLMPKNYRHLRPNEHLHHFTPTSLMNVSLHHDKFASFQCNLEDTIRKPWSTYFPNILTMGVRHLCGTR